MLPLQISMIKSFKIRDNHKMFVRTHAAIFLVCLLLCDTLQGLGSIMNLPWILNNRAFIGPMCTAQAAIKQTGNVGTAIWSFIIAIHTFSLLFLRRKMTTLTVFVVFVLGWVLVVVVVILGPVVISTKAKGPFYGISGYWCWITGAYPTERVCCFTDDKSEASDADRSVKSNLVSPGVLLHVRIGWAVVCPLLSHLPSSPWEHRPSSGERDLEEDLLPTTPQGEDDALCKWVVCGHRR